MPYKNITHDDILDVMGSLIDEDEGIVDMQDAVEQTAFLLDADPAVVYELVNDTYDTSPDAREMDRRWQGAIDRGSEEEMRMEGVV